MYRQPNGQKSPYLFLLHLGGTVANDKFSDFPTIPGEKLVEMMFDSMTKTERDSFEAQIPYDHIKVKNLFSKKMEGIHEKHRRGKDSTDILHRVYPEIFQNILSEYAGNNIDNIVISMGSDTQANLGYSTAFHHLKKPYRVVLTGSAIKPEETGTDALENLKGACLSAIDHHFVGDYIFFHNLLWPAARVDKVSMKGGSFPYDFTFKNPSDYHHFAEYRNGNIVIPPEQKRRYSEYQKFMDDAEEWKERLGYQGKILRHSGLPDLVGDITLRTTTQGKDILSSASGKHVLVVSGWGSGGLSEELMPYIEDVSKSKLVIVCSRVQGMAVEPLAYEANYRAALIKAVPAKQMNADIAIEKSIAVLALTLKKDGFDLELARRLMATPLCNEIDPEIMYDDKGIRLNLSNDELEDVLKNKYQKDHTSIQPLQSDVFNRDAVNAMMAHTVLDSIPQTNEYEGYRALVVENFAESRLYLRKLLEKKGMQVIEATSAEEAIQESLKHSPDMTFCDLKLNGTLQEEDNPAYQALVDLGINRPSICITSGYLPGIQEARQRGHIAIEKPIKPHEVDAFLSFAIPKRLRRVK